MTESMTSVAFAALLIAGAITAGAVHADTGTGRFESAPNPITKTWTFDIDPDRDIPSYGAGAAYSPETTDVSIERATYFSPRDYWLLYGFSTAIRPTHSRTTYCFGFGITKP